MANCDYAAFRKWFLKTVVNVESNKEGIPDDVRTDMLKAWNAGYRHAIQQADPLTRSADSAATIADELRTIASRLKALED